MQFLHIFEILSHTSCAWQEDTINLNKGKEGSAITIDNADDEGSSEEGFPVGHRMIQKIPDIDDVVSDMFFKEKMRRWEAWCKYHNKTIDDLKNLNDIDLLKFWCDFSTYLRDAAHGKVKDMREYKEKVTNEHNKAVSSAEKDIASLFTTTPQMLKTTFFNSFIQHVVEYQNGVEKGKKLRMLGYNDTRNLVVKETGSQDYSATLFECSDKYSEENIKKAIDNYLKNVRGIERNLTREDRQNLLIDCYVHFIEGSTGHQCFDELIKRMMKKTKDSKGPLYDFLTGTCGLDPNWQKEVEFKPKHNKETDGKFAAARAKAAYKRNVSEQTQSNDKAARVMRKLADQIIKEIMGSLRGGNTA